MARRANSREGAAPYDFAPYLRAVAGNWYEEDRLLQRIVARHAPEAAGEARGFLSRWGETAAGRFRELADLVERPEKAPAIERKDPYNRRNDHVVLPPETVGMLGEALGAGLAGSPSLNDVVRYAALYLLGQNGESGIACSLACTDGLIRALRRLGTDDRSKAALARLLANKPGAVVHGAQFVTEVQGGSDAATNTLRARQLVRGLYGLFGEKWFCSNCTADYWLLTARPEGAPAGAKGVALFVVPRMRDDGAPNGYHLERLKEKLGTRALPTGEITFDGAEGWMLGPADAGLKHMVGLVLVTSRVFNVLAGAALSRRAAREVSAYAGFRQAFGRPLTGHPLVADAVGAINAGADRAAAGAFETLRLWLRADPLGRAPGDVAARVHVSLAKAVATRNAARLCYDAMVLLGGNGIEERFSALPRLTRDAAIYETWEGPYTLLIMQALDDLARFGVRGKEREFLDLLWPGGHAPETHARDLARVLAQKDEAAAARALRDFAHAWHQAFEEAALAAVSGS